MKKELHDLEEIVLNAREWQGYKDIRETTGILFPRYLGEQLDGNTVSFESFVELERVTFKKKPLYLVTDWGTYDA